MKFFKPLNRAGAIRVFAKRVCAFSPKIYLLLKFSEMLLNRIRGVVQEKEYLLLMDKISDCKSVVDVGANIGQSAVSFNLLFPKAVIHSFEPNRDCLRSLNMVAKLFDNIVVHSIGLGERREVKDFWVPVVDGIKQTQLGSADPEELLKLPSYEWIHDQIEIFSLDEFDLSCDVLKIDVQGLEMAVLLGAVRTVKNCRPLIVVEHNGKSVSLDQLFSEWNYERIPTFEGSENLIYAPKLAA